MAYKPTAEDKRELARCHPRNGVKGFIRFCEKHCWIQDKKTKRELRFVLFQCQKDLAADLVSGVWLLVLKARQLGVTWLCAAYCLWRALYDRFWTAVVINQSLPYAEDFIADKVKFIYDRLPKFFQMEINRETRKLVCFGKRHGSQIMAYAGNARAARSKTGNLNLYDEGAFIDDLATVMQAADPVLANTHGQSVVVSTSNGPSGKFYQLAKAARKGQGRYKFRFYDWRCHPDRTDEWYAAEQQAHLDNPRYMQQEFPSTPEEAFLAGGGRIFPFFARETHQLVIPQITHTRENGLSRRMFVNEDGQPVHYDRYRAVDWGETVAPFVCLWLCHIPSDKPRLTVDPECQDFIEEMEAYSYKEGTEDPLKEHDHGPDCIRYARVTFDLRGHIHVYRNLYVFEAVNKGHTAATLIKLVKEGSGYRFDQGLQRWVKTDRTEFYRGTVFDRHEAILENEFMEYDIRAIPHEKPDQAVLGHMKEVKCGILMVNKHVVGSLPQRIIDQMTQAEINELKSKTPDPMGRLGIRASVSLRERMVRSARKRRKRARRRSRFSHHRAE